MKRDGPIRSNSHKLPEQRFVRERLCVAAIVEEWRLLLTELWSQCPHLKLICTVSPIRHWKDGAHANQLSKATLLLALDALQAEFPDRISYFPAYEILLDELRDYRFYADDMLHPSPLAIDYIAESFAQTYFDPETQKARQAWNKLRNAIAHRPLQPEREASRHFLAPVTFTHPGDWYYGKQRQDHCEGVSLSVVAQRVQCGSFASQLQLPVGCSSFCLADEREAYVRHLRGWYLAAG